MTIFSLIVILLFAGAALAQTGEVTTKCGFEKVEAVDLTDKEFLRGIYRLNIQVDGSAETIKATMLVLNEEGKTIVEVPVEDQAIFEIKLRGKSKVVEKNIKVLKFQARGWVVTAPAVLFKIEATSGIYSDRAFCSPYAAVHVEPANRVVSSSKLLESAPADIEIGVSQMEPESIKIEVDCIDIVAALGADLTVPGTTYSGLVNIGANPVRVQDLAYHSEAGIISFTLLDLPGGAHTIRPSATPVYMNKLPFFLKLPLLRRRPIGALKNEGLVSVFRVIIESPPDGAAVPLDSTRVSGTVVHGLPDITKLRVDGGNFQIPLPVKTAGDGCVGDTYTADFEVTLPASELVKDFQSGDDELYGLDPGVNFVSVLVNDALGHSTSDRIRLIVGQTFNRNIPTAILPRADECEILEEVEGFVKSGFSFSISQSGIDKAIRKYLKPLLEEKIPQLASGLTTETFERDRCPEGRRLSSADFGDSLRKRRRLAPPVSIIPDQTVSESEFLEIDISDFTIDPDGDDWEVEIIDPPEYAGIERDENGTWVFFMIAPCGTAGQVIPIELKVKDVNDEEDIVNFNVEVKERPSGSVGFPAKVESFTITPELIEIDVDLVTEDKMLIKAETGPIGVRVTFDFCFKDCLIGCCLGLKGDVSVSLTNFAISLPLSKNNLVCGADGLEDTSFNLGTVDVDIEELDFTGIFSYLCYLFPLCAVFQALDSAFDTDVAEQIISEIANLVINGVLKSSIEEALPGVLEEQELPGLKDFRQVFKLSFPDDLPFEIPLSLGLLLTNDPIIKPFQSISMGIHTVIIPEIEEDETPPWPETTSVRIV
jgi:hypothetical protein